MSSLKVCTALSAKPLDEGWYGADVTCVIPFYVMNSLVCSLTKHCALSDTIISGIPRVLKLFLKQFSVFADVADATGYTSNHFENG